MPRCPECGVDLEEIPFDDCNTHQTHFAAEPALTETEIKEYLEDELARILYERTGDD